MKKQPTLFIIAGPNGSGKTTFAKKFLPEVSPGTFFLNADVIASAIAPLNPDENAIQAGKLLLRQVDDCYQKGVDFAFETTLSGSNYVKRIAEMRSAGYHIVLIFLWMPSVELSVARVKNRVRMGGHNIPEAVIRRRFEKGLSNFFSSYQKLADVWYLVDNSGEQPRVIASQSEDGAQVNEIKLYEGLKKKYA